MEKTLIFFSLLFLLNACGCGVRKMAGQMAEKALSSETAVSLTVKGDDARLNTLLRDLVKLGVNPERSAENIKTGVRVVKIIGTYAQVLKALNWMIAQGLKLIANNERTAQILKAVMVAGLK